MEDSKMEKSASSAHVVAVVKDRGSNGAGAGADGGGGGVWILGVEGKVVGSEVVVDSKADESSPW